MTSLLQTVIVLIADSRKIPYHEAALRVLDQVTAGSIPDDFEDSLREARGWLNLDKSGTTGAPTALDLFVYVADIESSEVVLAGVPLPEDNVSTAEDLYKKTMPVLIKVLGDYDAEAQPMNASSVIEALRARYATVAAVVEDRKKHQYSNLAEKMKPKGAPTFPSWEALKPIKFEPAELAVIRRVRQKFLDGGANQAMYNSLKPDERKILLLSNKLLPPAELAKMPAVSNKFLGLVHSSLVARQHEWGDKYEPL